MATNQGRPTAEIFAENYIPEPNSGCWLWTAGSGNTGYACAYDCDARKQIYGHRLAWKLYRGEIPTGLYVLHRCDVRLCVNPDHLFLGTKADNNADRARKGRSNHPLGRDNPRAKLDEVKVAHLKSFARLLRKDAERLAAEWGVSVGSLYTIRSGYSWKQVN